MTTRIVEIPVAPLNENEVASNAIPKIEIQRPSVDLDGFLNTEYLDFLSSGTTTSPNSGNIKKDDPSGSSSPSIYSLEPEDFNSNFFDDDDLLSPYANNNSNSDFSPFPESPSMQDLRSKLCSLEKPSMAGHKQEKEEDNEEESSQASSASEDESEEALINKEAEMQTFQMELQNAEELRPPIKKTRIGIQKNSSISSISSYSSGASSSDENDFDHEHEEDLDDEYDDEVEEPLVSKNDAVMPKKYQQPASFRAEDLVIGAWSLKKLVASTGENITFDLKILFGRKKLKYELCYPQKNSKYKKTIYSLDFPFNFISALEFKNSEKKITLQLSERPSFSKKEKGKCSRSTDFTDSNASTYQRHSILMENEYDFTDFMEKLLSSDKRLRQLSRVGLPQGETSFPAISNNYVAVGIPPCDWDKDSKASKRCEDCKSNYCDVCDDVLHRHENQKTHRRVPIEVYVRPVPPPKAKKCTMKKRKKMNNDRCRCGTGATKGTLGEPCTGNRCPCFSNGKSCVHCGCKGCANPIKRNPRSPSLAKQAVSV